MRLIDADALYDRLQNLAYDDWNQGTGTTWANAYSECADMVEDAQTIETESIEQIRWERDTAIQQLADLGYGLGEKPRTDGDCISRQAAIDAINHICPVDTEYDCALLDRVDVRCVLSDLPSVQQEIIKCIECKHHKDEEPGMVYCPIIVGGWVREDCFCWNAERRTDENN